MSGTWQHKKLTRRHRCEDHLPGHVPGDVAEGDRWKCPRCRRSWHLAHKQKPGEPPRSSFIAEGVSLDAPDGSVYWRAFRARLVGRIYLG